MGYVQEARENHVKKKVEEALRSKMKQKALKECDQFTAKYAECAAGRTLSVVWRCRKQAKQLNDCLHLLTSMCYIVGQSKMKKKKKKKKKKKPQVPLGVDVSEESS
ncbi:uncharacterized protein LOC131153842 isoform X3 [Malania oleifera]|uniref:uncharacterized protein LOC131153842 isoform X3 n=1 Tax=Malania oleifera TaxID=397392 RepID=UPI0025AE7A34|nr:uncharacterized protein LOC131153842 isoform X3 [Malania oleifera]